MNRGCSGRWPVGLLMFLGGVCLAAAQTLTSVTLSPTTVVGGNPSTGTVNLSAAAPAGGALVTLSSNNAAAVVPANLTVTAGALSATFGVTTTVVTANQLPVITATYSAVNKTATLTVKPLLFTVSVSPATVVGGLANSTGTVTLNAVAPTGGTVVTLSSNNAAASVPASVTVLSGATTATFTVTTSTVAANATVTVTASNAGAAPTATLTMQTLLASVALNQTSVIGGYGATETVTLNLPAPAGGTVVTLTSSVPARATVPASITIPAGATLGTFPITSLPVTTSAATTITAGNAGALKTASLTVTPSATAYAVTLDPSTAFGTSTSTGTVILNGPAPVGGAVVALSSTVTTAATVPASVTVPEGALSATFTISTLTVASNTTSLIKGTFGGVTAQATLTVASALQSFSVALNPTSVIHGATSTATVTLNGVAPTGGAVVTLTSSSTANATVPPNVTVTAGARSATFTVTTLSGGAAASINISGAYGGTTKTGTLFLTSSAAPYAVSFSPSPVLGGNASTGTVTLNGAAPVGGLVVSLFSTDTVDATVPASVTVAEAATTATFAVTTFGVSAPTDVSVYATAGAVSVKGTISLTSAALSGLTLSLTSVTAGTSSTGTVTLSTPAAPGGAIVGLISSNTAAATVPATVTVLSGATSATFTVTTLGVASTATVSITASRLGVSFSPALTVNPAAISSIAVSPTAVISGTSSAGTVTLTGKAPPAGAVVTLSSNNTAAATVLASVTVAAQATSATFTVTTLGVASAATPTITATYLTVPRTATLTVNPAAISAVSVSPTTVVGGNNSTGTVTLTGKAPPAGAVVTLLSSITAAATVSANVTVAAQATTATFTVTTLGVASAATPTITATYLTVPKTTTLTVNPAAISAVSVSPTTVVGGNNSTGTVTLTGKAPPGGAVVTLSSNNTAAATVPANVTVAAQATTATFTVTTLGVASAATPTITATYLTVPKTATLTVNPAAISTVSVSPTSVVSGTSSTGTVTLTGKAPTGGAVVTLSSGNTAAATVPANVTVAAGASTATFTASTLGVASSTPVTLTATYLTVPVTTTLTVTPAANSSLGVSPTSVTGGTSSTGTVTLTGKAPPGGAVVTLSSGNGAVTVPANVTVATNATTATFTATTTAVGSNTAVTLTSTYLTVPKTATLTVNAPAPSSVALAPATVIGGVSSTGTVTLNGPAPTGGSTVTLASSNMAAATVPASVTVAAGATTATFTVTSIPIGANASSTISALYNSVTKTAVLSVLAAVPSSVTLSPSTVVSGATSTGTVTLTGTAMTGGVVVGLSSNNTSAATVPASVTVAAGSTSATFTITSLSVASSTAVSILASVGASTQSATLTVTPCVFGTAPPPSSFPAGETIWVEDQFPAGSNAVGTWSWDTSQKASGTQSHTAPVTAGPHSYGFDSAWSANLYVATTDKLIAYVLIDPCNPPQEIMIQWNGSLAFWGADLIDSGSLGVTRFSMGPLPAAGQWVRLEAPVSTLGLGGQAVGYVVYALYDGRAWFDRTGKAETCTPPIAAAPSSPPPDTVWVEDALPTGSWTSGTWVWDTTQKASGTASHTDPATGGQREHVFYEASPSFPVSATDVLAAYVLLNPCDPPQEIMIQWGAASDGWEHRAYWGADLIGYGTPGTAGRIFKGALPTAGQWVRLQVPASELDLEGKTVTSMSFVTYGGQAWWDRVGKGTASGAPTLASLVVAPPSVTGGSSATGTATLSGAALAGGQVVTLTSSDTSVATVPSNVTVPQGASSATFTVTSLAVSANSSAVITGFSGSDSRTATLFVTSSPPALSSVSIVPTSVVGGTSSTGTVTFTGPVGANAVVALWSANTSVANVPSSVTVSAGAATGTFTATTASVASFSTVAITATYGVVNKTASITAIPAGACALGSLPAPSPLPPDVVWFDDDAPAGSNAWGPWTWDTAQKVSGAQSHTEPPTLGMHQHGFDSAWTNALYIAETDKIVTYVLIDPCDPPQEVMLQWNDGNWEHRAFWGSDLMAPGAPGTGALRDMGPLPAAGQWARLEIPASLVDLGGRTVYAMAFTLIDGRAWFDRTGKAATCTPVIAQTPASDPAETIWVDDQIPPGVVSYGTWNWDTTQKAGGAQSHTEPGTTELHYHGFDTAWGNNFYVEQTDKLIAWVLIDPCDPPQEILIDWQGTEAGERFVFWGADVIPWGTLGVDRIAMGPLPSTGQWVRLEVPASTIGLGSSLIGQIRFTLFDGHVWWDRVGKLRTCLPGAAASPAADPTETIWLDDQVPAGATTYGGWTWDTAQKANGTQSHTDPASDAVHYHAVNNAWASNFYVQATDSVFAWILIDPCDPPKEVLMRFDWGGGIVEHAFWGSDLIGWGTLGVDRFNMGPLPPAGQWFKLEFPASTLGLGGHIIGEIVFAAYDGHAWWDRVGKRATCVPPIAAAPGSLPPDVVWIEDAVPTGATSYGTWNWDTTQVASGSQSHHDPGAAGIHQHFIQGAGANPMVVGTAESLVCYVLIDPCDPPAELMLQWLPGDGLWHQAYWGANAMGTGMSMGALPAAGQWTRLEVPASAVGLGGTTVTGMAFTLYGGHAWFDRAGKGPTAGSTSLSSVTFNPSTVVGGNPSTGTVTLTAAAPTGGALVALSSGNTSAATVPGSVTVPAGSTSSTFSATTLAVGVSASSTITATYAGTNRSAVLSVTPPGAALLAVSLSPTTLVGGSPSTGTVTLTAAAPTGGAVVVLSSDTTAAATVPGSVTVPAGSTSATFTVTTLSVGSSTGVTITASWGGVSKTAALTVTPVLSLAAVSLSPATLVGGDPSTGTVTLVSPAPTGGTLVTLASSATSVATVPASVTVPQGQTSANFTVTTLVVSSTATPTISASRSGQTVSATLTVLPAPTLYTLSFNPIAVVGGDPSTGTVTLTGAAPGAGVTVTLSSSNTGAATVLGSVTVPAGSASKTFTVTSLSVGSSTSVTISATNAGSTLSANLTVLPLPTLTRTKLGPNIIAPTGTATGTVLLSGPAPAAGASVALASANTSLVTVPSTVVVPGGSTSATFTATPVGSGASTTVSGTYRSTTLSDWIAVTTGPNDLSLVWLTPSTLVGGGPATVGVALNVPTLTSRTITLSSSNPSVLPLPASLTIAPFKGGASVTVATTTVASTTPVTITATSGSTVKTAVLTVTPAPALSSLLLAPTSVTFYGTSTGTVTLNAPAPPGGATVALSTPTPSLLYSLPASLVVPAGLRSATFSVLAGTVTTATDVTINAAYNGNTLAATLNVTPTAAPLDVKITPAVLKGGTSASGIVTLNGALTTTVTVALVSSQPAVLGVPANVSIYAGQTASSPFTVTTAPTSLPTSVTVSATYGGSTKTTTVSLTPGAAVSNLTAGATSVVAGSTTTGTVFLDGTAGVGGETASLESSDVSAASVPDTVTVPAGASGASFTITAGAVSQTSLARLSASVGGQTSTLDVTVTPTPVVVSFRLDLTSLTGGGTRVSTGTVTLNGPAPAGGLTISLSSDNPAAASVPATLTIPAGSWQATFIVTTRAVSDDTTVAISATAAGSTAGTTLTVRRPRVQSVAVTPTFVTGRQRLTGTVTLDAPAPPGGVAVDIWIYPNFVILVTLPPNDTYYGRVILNEGQSQADFPVDVWTVYNNDCWNSVYLNAQSGSDDQKVAQFIYYNLSVSAVQVNPSRVVGGGTAAVTVWLNGTPLTPSGVGLSSSNPAVVSVPSSVVMSGQSLTFNVTTSSVSADTPVTISATNGQGPLGVPYTASTVLTVVPSTTVASLTLTPSNVVGGASSTGKVTLTAGAPAGGAVVTLGSNSPKATVPASVTVLAGLDNATFTVTTTSVSSLTSATITATYGAGSQSAALSISAAPAVSTVTITPASVTGGTAASGTVTLNAAAPSGGVAVSLSSSNTSAATVTSPVTVAQGQVSATFTVTTLAVAADANVTITATGGSSSATAPLTVRVPSPQLDGVAPGAALPGDSNLVAYGSNFASTTTIQMSGPVYTLTNTTTALCTVSVNCPTVTPPSVVNGTFNAISFSLPVGLTTGYYWVQAKSASGALSGGAYVRVDAALKTRAVVAPTQHNNAPSILSGQTFVGTFAANNDPTNTFGDYNDFYFVATAGTTINVTLDRADTTLPWEHPDALDPQIQVIAPDGVVYANLRATDRQPAIDLNATLSSAVLPLTGVYYLRAATLKGFGDYRLTFSYGSVAAAPAAQRSIAFAGSVNTVPLNTSVSLQAVMLDPRGYQTSGAMVQFSTANGVDDHATVQFPSGVWAYTNTDGVAAGSARPTTVGKAQLNATYTSTLLSSFVVQINTERTEAPIPRYAPVAIAPMRGVSVDEDGSLVTESGKYESLPVWTPAEPTTRSGSGSRRAVGEGLAPSRPAAGKSTAATSSSLPLPPGEGRGLPAKALAKAGEGRTGSGGAASPLSLPLTAVPESISTCSGALFTLAGVNWASTNPPYTVTLTDEMPSTGQPQPNGVVDALGIHGHRIEKTIRMKIDIKDASGATPPHAVLVNLALGGPSHGTLILDPDGNRVQCSTGSFLWHERDAQGNIIALNEEFEYKLGTYAPYVGAVPDTQNPPHVKPVWGTAEVLGLVISTVDGTGANLRQRYSYKVKPEPGKPDHFVSGSQLQGGPADPTFEFWSEAFHSNASGTRAGGGTKYVTDPVYQSNAYYLADVRNNVTFGYTNTAAQATVPSSNITPSLKDQTAGGTLSTDVDYPGYEIGLTWTNDPDWPQGTFSSIMSITYPNDPDWSGGTVTRSVPLQFDKGTFHSLQGIINGYDGLFLPFPGPAEDPSFPITVSPGATGDALPKVDPALSDPVYADQPARASFLILNNSTGGIWWANGPNPGDGIDTWAELSDSPAFKISLIDSTGKVATDAQFQVHLCPRIDHQNRNSPRLCDLAPVVSPVGTGVVQSVRVNPNGPGDSNSRGYMGVELLKAPANPGNYFLKFESLAPAQYRIRELSQKITDYSATGEYQGAFAFVTVVGAELLNENFQRFSPTLNMSVDRVVYVRELDLQEAADSHSADVILENEISLAETTLQNVTLRRVGRSSTFMSDAISIVSPDPPLASLSTTAQGLETESAMPLLTLGIRSTAGVLSPPPGLYMAKMRRTGSTVKTKLHEATTRLVEILKATPNFDGVTPGTPLDGPGPIRRDRIEAKVKWGEDGYVAGRLVNVGDQRLFTFDYWPGQVQQLTTLLIGAQSLLMGPGQFAQRAGEAVIPSGQPFQALVAAGTTVKPGLYKVRVQWGKTQAAAESPSEDSACITDMPGLPVCVNEWLVSVGQRIVLDVEPVALTNLAGYLAIVQQPEPAASRRSVDTFLRDVASTATAVYADAGANVTVSRDTNILRPYMTQRIRARMTSSDCTGGGPPPTLIYGCTNNAAAFPLLDPNLDLAVTAAQGISLYDAYYAPSPIINPQQHEPLQPRNATSNLWSSENPSPSQVLFNRLTNLVVHETGHGFGIVSPKPYTIHGPTSVIATMKTVEPLIIMNVYSEQEVTTDLGHEPINGLTFSWVDWETQLFVMQVAPYRWLKKLPTQAGSYDTPVWPALPQDWLLFDRPLMFSKTSHFTGTPLPDYSIERFFRERVPLCQVPATRTCR